MRANARRRHYRVPVSDSPVVRRRLVAALVLLTSVVALAHFTAGSSSRSASPTTSARAPAGGSHKGTTGGGAGAAGESRQGLDRAVRGVLRHSAFVARGGGERREIALTFDDGPGPYTPKILIALNRLNVKATFFVIGQQVHTFNTATMAAVRRGHSIGDHTEGHKHLGALSAVDQYGELETPLEWLSKYGLPRPLLFRPPYGSYDRTTLEQLKRLGLLMVLWSVDSQDYRRPGVEQIVERAVAGAKPGAIILLHDGGGDRTQTVQAIPKIVGRLRARHYHLVTVPRLLRDDPPPAGRPLPQLRTEGGT